MSYLFHTPPINAPHLCVCFFLNSLGLKLHTHGHGAIHWSMGCLPEATDLKVYDHLCSMAINTQ